MASIIKIRYVFETCFRDRGIDRLCMKRVSEIGAFDGLCAKRVSEIGVLIGYVRNVFQR